MKNQIKLLSICCLLVLSISINGQEINQLAKGVTRGVITLQDGNSVKFRQLQIVNDSTISYLVDGNTVYQKSSSIFKVTKTGNYFLAGAIGGALGGALGLLRAGDTFEGLELPLIAGCTALGAIWGLCIRKETVVFKNKAALTFYPTLNTDQLGRYYPMLSLNINLK